MSLTDFLAGYGAALATLVGAWDVYKWINRGASVQVDVSERVIQAAEPQRMQAQYSDCLVAIATNNGDRPATITNLGGYWYRTRLQRLLRRPETKFVIAPRLINPQAPIPTC